MARSRDPGSRTSSTSPAKRNDVWFSTVASCRPFPRIGAVFSPTLVGDASRMPCWLGLTSSNDLQRAKQRQRVVGKNLRLYAQLAIFARRADDLRRLGDPFFRSGLALFQRRQEKLL